MFFFIVVVAFVISFFCSVVSLCFVVSLFRNFDLSISRYSVIPLFCYSVMALFRDTVIL